MVRRDHPLTRTPPTSLDDLDSWGWMLSESGSLFRQRLDLFYIAEGRQPPQPVIEVSSRRFALSLVANTDHIGVATQENIDNIAPGAVVMLDYPFIWNRTVGVMRRRDEMPSILLDSLIERTRGFFPDRKAPSRLD